MFLALWIRRKTLPLPPIAFSNYLYVQTNLLDRGQVAGTHYGPRSLAIHSWRTTPPFLYPFLFSLPLPPSPTVLNYPSHPSSFPETGRARRTSLARLGRGTVCGWIGARALVSTLQGARSSNTPRILCHNGNHQASHLLVRT